MVHQRRDIHATEAWDIYKGTSNNIIAIIGGGINKTHPDLDGKVTGDDGVGWDGHETHVAGIAAAETNNSIGIAGVDWNANLHSQRIDDIDDVGISDAIKDAVDYSSNVHVLNNSWSLQNPEGRNSTTVRMAFAYAYKENRTAVVNMGNSDGSLTNYPAGFKQGIIAVGALDNNDQHHQSSNTGNHIDVTAPGINIYSTDNNNSYGYRHGTSFAAPFVSGIASLLKGYNSNLENDDIENIIRISTDKVSGMGGNDFTTKYGTGRVNARKALDYLRTPYTLEQKSVTGGGSIYSSTGMFTIKLYGFSGIPDGEYPAKRHEIRRTINLENTYLEKFVWGRGVNTYGFSNEEPNFGMGWCDIVSSNSTSITLRTYSYQIYFTPYYISFFYPTTSNVRFEYTILGDIDKLPTPTITMSGGFGDNPTLTFSGGGSSIDHYVLKKEYDFGSGFGAHYVNPSNNPYTDNNVQISRFGDLIARYSVKVVDAIGNESSYSNTVSTSGQSLWKSKESIDESANITNFALLVNYPNPFNPTTHISYEIPKDGFVNLVVYNTLGQIVEKLVNKQQSSGRYSVRFNANNLPSGIYMYKLQVGEFSSVRKMLLTK